MMTHEAWIEAAGHLAGVAWHLQTAGIHELKEPLDRARFLLEEKRHPAAAARKLVAIGVVLRQEESLAARLERYELSRARPPGVADRLSQLATDWTAHRTVENLPARPPVAASWEARSV